ncbi:pseudouridine synthase [Phycisphaerales bacterium AB-hyl4]|uniref:Pseudouridine synthase n=1 Tax=Natronomicrosphaera hydrolytica TaxID=3242702 RepID=A0ABV4U6C7_9BACT
MPDSRDHDKPAHARSRDHAKADTAGDLRDASRGIRLQKAMAEAGVASRRACETLIEEGRVRVNGTPVRELPAWVDPANDRIEVDGQPLPRPRKTDRRTARHTYVMLHKPRNVISTTDDPEQRKTVLDLVDLPGHARLYPVGRLDADSTGLMLLTDDGELANRLTHPRYGVTKQYRVSIRGKLDANDLVAMKKGLFLAAPDRGDAPRRPGPPGKPGGPSPRAKRASVEQVRILGFERDRARGDRTTLAITLREGQNREIRRLLARLGYKVRRLKRMAIGPLQLKGLGVGQWRLLDARERQALYREAGMH